MNIKPDWNQIASSIGGSLTKEELNDAWIEKCNLWLQAIRDKYGEDYRIRESENVFILSNENDRYIEIFSKFLEKTIQRILKTLNGIAEDEGYGKHVAIIFNDLDQYYDYVFIFYPEEGEFGLSSGMYINEGYGHFVFPSQDITSAEPIAVHELTHACLAHLPIPTWLNEGLAVSMEDVLAGNHFYIDTEIIEKHKKYWNQETIQEFWKGSSFYSSDEGQELSYNLAHVLVRSISSDYERFKCFVNNASFEDAGEKACQEYFGSSLQKVVEAFLGTGNWKPLEDIHSRGEQVINSTKPTGVMS